MARWSRLGNSIGCLLFKGIFKTVSLLPQESLNEKISKYMVISKMCRLVKKFSLK